MGHGIQNNYILFHVFSRSSHRCDGCLGPHENPSTKYGVSQSLSKEVKDVLFCIVFWFADREKIEIENTSEKNVFQSCASNF